MEWFESYQVSMSTMIVIAVAGLAVWAIAALIRVCNAPHWSKKYPCTECDRPHWSDPGQSGVCDVCGGSISIYRKTFYWDGKQWWPRNEWLKKNPDLKENKLP